MSWTVDRVERLTTMWAEGLSGAQIAVELGEISRNGVIGKVHRLKLAKRANIAMPRTTPKPRPKPRIKIIVHRFGEPPPKPEYDVHVLDWHIHCSRAQSGMRPCTLMELSATRCHWPLWTDEQPERLYCGAVALEKAPYCGAHTKLAWRRRQ